MKPSNYKVHGEYGLIPFELIQFPGGEPHVKFKHTPESQEVVIEAHVSDGNLVPLFVLTDALLRHGCPVSLYIPYFPGARQDRGTPLTVKVYADLINSQGYERVIIVDPHSDVTPALIDRVTVVPQVDVFTFLHDENCIPWSARSVLVSPDLGASKKTEEIAARHHYPIAYGRKHRNPKTGELSGFTCDTVPPDRIPIVVDDICDGGGTFIGLAEQFETEQPAWLVVTHGIFSKPTESLQKAYPGGIVCTDSFTSVHYDNRIITVPITDWVLNKYYYNNTGE